jgi:capsular polysaccharide biosynthesis protein
MENQAESTISIMDFVRYFFKHWIITGIVILLAPAFGAIYTYFQTPMYDASAQIVVLDTGRQSTTGVSRDTILGNYVAIAKSPKTLNQVAGWTSQSSASGISKGLTVKNEKGSEVISIRYASSTPNTAADTVDKTIAAFKNSLYDLYGIKGESISIIAAPVDSIEPYNIQPVRDMLIATAAGIVAAIIIAFIRFDYAESKKTADPEFLERERKQREKLSAENAKILDQEIQARHSEMEARNQEAEVRLTEARIAQADAERALVDAKAALETARSIASRNAKFTENPIKIETKAEGKKGK